MADDPKDKDATEPTELEALVQQIGDLESAEDIQLEESRSMLKGAIDALGTIAGLLKLERTASTEPLEKGGGDSPHTVPMKKADEDDEGDDDDEDDDDPGYQDMDMASEYVEVTDLLEDLAKAQQIQLEANRALMKENRRLHQRIERLEKAVAQSRDLQINGLEATAALNAELIKGQASFMERMSSVLHERPMAFGHPRPPLRAIRAHKAKPQGGEAEVIAHSPQQTKRLLAKALGQRIITDLQVSHYQQHGRFDADDETNQRLVTDVKALAS